MKLGSIREGWKIAILSAESRGLREKWERLIGFPMATALANVANTATILKMGSTINIPLDEGDLKLPLPSFFPFVPNLNIIS